MAVLIGGGTLAEGGAIVPGTFTTSQQPYLCWNDASYELAIPASDGSYPRIETIVLRVYDNAIDSSGKTEAVFGAVKGTATVGATLSNLSGIAAFPKSSLLLGYVLVPAKATSIVTADIANVATTMAAVLARGQVYTAREEVAFNAKHAAPQPTRAAAVSIDVELVPNSSSGIGVKVLVGGVAVVELFAAINGTGVRQCFTFELQPGEEWEVTYTELSGAKAAGLHASYRAL
jgi:hypothetical protein